MIYPKLLTVILPAPFLLTMLNAHVWSPTYLNAKLCNLIWTVYMIGLSSGAYPLILKKYEVLRVSYYPVSCWQTLHYRCQVTYCDGLGRDLGVPESSNLTWSLNVSIVVAKANRMLRFLRSHWASHGFGPDRKRLLFSTFVRAHLGYASEVWACSILHLWS